ncbi:MAG: hypothetical protein GY697_10280, partial [Desulfobacterales bacterium]|nr:hypothetical protein [Desulfobacterales bacterium]
IEDMLNVGLNYVVTIGVVDENWPKNLDGEATFTIRVNPVVDDTGAGDPSYVGNDPVGIIPNVGTLHVSPSPEFDPGQTLDISVADANATNVSVSVKNRITGEEESVVLAVVDQYFLGQILTSTDPADKVNSGVLYVRDGDEVQISYTDAEPANTVTVTTRATAATFYVIPLPSGGAAVIVL